ncbi:MAG: Holliday junction branch migration protein RuvA [Candidatus Zixiibacteriota bacterium]
MISRLRGTLTQVSDQWALVENSGLYYEVLLPSGLAGRLKESGTIGREISLETIYYIEAGDKKANEYPRLVGFIDPIDREFFSLLTQVPGLGVKKALKSLVLPIRDIATAIETKDASTLTRLPGVGARLAEKIVAELHGKTAKYALSKAEEPLAMKVKARSPLMEEAVEVLLQLQYKRAEAEQMVDAAIKSSPRVDRVEDLITVIFKSEQKTKAEVQ